MSQMDLWGPSETTPTEPPVVNSSMVEIVLVLAVTENSSVKFSTVLEAPASVVNVALNGVF